MIDAQSQDVYDEHGHLEDVAKIDADWAATLKSWLNHILLMIGVRNQKSLQDEYLPRLIQNRMESMMGDIIADKLATKGMKAISQVMPETEQARFFYKTLKELRQVKESMRPQVRLQNAVASAKTSVKSQAT
jgi:hypothetical protein